MEEAKKRKELLKKLQNLFKTKLRIEQELKPKEREGERGRASKPKRS